MGNEIVISNKAAFMYLLANVLVLLYLFWSAASTCRDFVGLFGAAGL